MFGSAMSNAMLCKNVTYCNVEQPLLRKDQIETLHSVCVGSLDLTDKWLQIMNQK